MGLKRSNLAFSMSIYMNATLRVGDLEKGGSRCVPDLLEISRAVCGTLQEKSFSHHDWNNHAEAP